MNRDKGTDSTDPCHTRGAPWSIDITSIGYSSIDAGLHPFGGGRPEIPKESHFGSSFPYAGAE